MSKNTIIITEARLAINSSEINTFYVPTDVVSNPKPIEEGPPFAIDLYAWKEEGNKNYKIAGFSTMEDFTEAISGLFTAIRKGEVLWDVRDYL